MKYIIIIKRNRSIKKKLYNDKKKQGENVNQDRGKRQLQEIVKLLYGAII